MYRLQKYGRTTKHTCPQCKRPRCFVYYVNEEGKALDPTVGRCDHESRCGYHKKPREFFDEHPNLQMPESWKKPEPIKERTLCTLPPEFVTRYFSTQSTLGRMLYRTFGEIALDVMTAYGFGALINGATIYFQIDKAGRVRAGKVMEYGEDGHRIKTKEKDNVTWLHALLWKSLDLPTSWELTQCLFGEHLTATRKDHDVYLVESEKTAAICAMKMPDKLWLATGGKDQLKPEMLAAIKDRHIWAIPDADQIDEDEKKWGGKVPKLKQWFDIDIIDPGYTEEDKEQHRDLADLILQNL